MATAGAIKTSIALDDRVSSVVKKIAANMQKLSDRFNDLNSVADAVSDIEIDIDTSDAIDSVNDIVENIEDIQDSTDDLSDSLSDASYSIIDTVDSASDNMQDLNDVIDDVSDNIVDNLDDIQDDLEDLADDAEDSTEQAELSFSNLAEAVAACGVVDAIKNIGESMLGLSENADEFETSMAKVSTIADNSVLPLGEMGSQVKNASLELGQGMNDIADATYQALSASVETSKAIGFTADATKLSVAGFTSASTAVDVLTTALNAYKLEASESSKISDMLITTQNLGKTTVDELAASVGKVIPLASAYSVQIDNLLTAYAQLTKNGIATAESGTYLKSMLQELGDTGSDVAGVLADSTGKSFKELMEDGNSLGDVLDMIGDAVEGDTVRFNALWSSQEAGIGALSLFNATAEDFNNTLDQMQGSTGATETAFKTMSDVAEYAKKSMINSFSVLGETIGESLSPALKDVYNTGNEAAKMLNELANEHPIFVDAMTSMTTGVVSFMAVLSVLTAVSLPATKLAILRFTATLAANPWILMTAGAVAFTVAIYNLIKSVKATTNPMGKLTTACQEQENQLKALNDKYEDACRRYGEFSQEALDLKNEVDDLTKTFEANKETIGDLLNQADNLIDTTNKINETYEQSIADIDEQGMKIIALSHKLGKLATSTDKSAQKSEQMKDIVESLNNEFPGLRAQYGNTTDAIKKYADAVEKVAEANMVSEKMTSNNKQLAMLEEQAAGYEALLKKLNSESVALAPKAYNDMSFDDLNVGDSGSLVVPIRYGGAESDQYDAIQEKIRAVTDAMKENDEQMEKLKNQNAALQELYNEAWETAKSANNGIGDATAVAEAAQIQFNSQITDMQKAYDDAYGAARSSLEGQVGLFQEVSTKCDLSVDNMINSLKKQTDYIDNYKANLQALRDAGVSEALVTTLSDGTSESAGYAAQIAKEIENANGNASELVTKLNEAFEGKDKAMDSWSTYIASNNADVKNATLTALQGMYDAINDKGFNANITAGAKANVDSYLSGLTSPEVIEAVKGSIKNTTSTAVTQAVSDSASQAATKAQEQSKVVGTSIFQGIVNGMDGGKAQIGNSAVGLAETAIEQTKNVLEIHSPSKVMYRIGEYIVEGLINGLEAKKSALSAKVQELANIVQDNLKVDLEIHSPSKVTTRIGEFVDMGLINGIENLFGKVKAVSRRLADVATPDLSRDPESSIFDKNDNSYLSNASCNSSNGTKNVSINIDMSGANYNISSDYDINEIAEKLGDRIDEELNSSCEGVYE